MQRLRRRPDSVRARASLAATEPTPLVVMGRVAAPWGVRGWVKVQVFTESPDTLLGYPEWWLAGPYGEATRPRRVIEARRHSNWVVANLEGMTTREEASRYRGLDIAVPRATLPEAGDGEVYVADLVGCSVTNRQGVALGTVVGVEEAGAQQLLRVTGRASDSNEMLIPMVAAYVDEVDLEAGTVCVDWDPSF